MKTIKGMTKQEYQRNYYHTVTKVDPTKYLRRLETNEKWNYSESGIEKRKKAAKRYYQQNREKLLQYRKDYFKKNKR